MTTAMASWSGAVMAARLLMGVVALLTFVSAGLAYALVSVDRTVVLIAPDDGRSDSIGQRKASRPYMEAWALYVAQTLGNVTPDTVGFIKERIGPLLCPEIYNEAMVMLSDQVATVARDRVAISFEPRGVLFEEASGKVFVSGQAIDHAIMGAEKRYDRTFEFNLEINDYRVRVCGLTSYEGQPRTEEELARRHAREASAKAGSAGQ
jgi:conjugal transfer pilus assembly protein TraE